MRAHAQLVVARSAVDAEDLAGLRLFANADLDAVADLLADCPLQLLHPNEVLLTPNTASSALYLVLYGRLRVHLESPETDPARRVEAGDTVGEVSLLDAQPVSAYVLADTATSVLVIGRETLRLLLNTSHAVARNLLLMVVERMRANNGLVADDLRLHEQHRRQTNVDELTGLRNRRALEDLLRRQLLRSSMNREPLTLLMVDLDGFRGFNLEFGRAAGNHAIYAIARTLQDQVRPTDIVARLDGQRFAVVLPDSDANGARTVAARLCEAIAETVIMMVDQSILPSVTASIGIAETRSFDNIEDLLAQAETAVARAKNEGRNTFSI